jgi:hypothetical protein
MSTCPYPECEKEIGETLFACRPHWFSLPAELRAKIWRNYRRGNLEEILSGYEEAEHFWTGA